MKTERRLLVKGHEGTSHGPFRWTSVRDWVALGYFTPEDEVKAVEDTAWSPIKSRPELLALPPGASTADAFDLLRSRAREKRPVGPRAAAYLRRLGCPVRLERLNPYTAFHWVRILEELHPERIDATERWAAEEESHGRVPSATPDEATAEQIETLRARGHSLPPKLTRLEARRLISGPPTAEQLDRLQFYGITPPVGACEEEVAEIISRQMRENWDSEEAYQAYRRRPDTRQQRGERTAPVLKLRPSPTLDHGEFAPLSAAKLPPAGVASVDRPVAARARKRTMSPWLAVALLAALALLAAARWNSNRREKANAPQAAAPAREPARRAGATTVLDSPNPELGEKLRSLVSAQQVTGIVPGAEPRALINGRLVRAGDTIDPSRGLIVVKVDADNKAVVFTDAGGSIVQRTVE